MNQHYSKNACAVKEKEKYMFKHPKTTLWTREIHLKSDMWKDIEAYTSTSPVITAPKATKKTEVKSEVKSETKIAPAAKTAKVTPAAKTVKVPEVLLPA